MTLQTRTAGDALLVSVALMHSKNGSSRSKAVEHQVILGSSRLRARSCNVSMMARQISSSVLQHTLGPFKL
jgi:hypothetical protein